VLLRRPPRLLHDPPRGFGLRGDADEVHRGAASLYTRNLDELVDVTEVIAGK
jgi:hypothetical protein